MKIKTKNLTMIFRATIFILLVLFALLIFGWMPFVSLVRLSNDDPNSMYPTMYKGDQVMIARVGAETLEVGDIIVFELYSSEVVVMHRIQDIALIEGNYLYRTAGDNLNITSLDRSDEGYYIPYEDILGKVIWTIEIVDTLLYFFVGDTEEESNRNPLIFFFLILIMYLSTVYIIIKTGIKSPEVIEVKFDTKFKKKMVAVILGLLIVISMNMIINDVNYAESNINAINLINQVNSSDSLNNTEHRFTHYRIQVFFSIAESDQFISLSALITTLQNETLANTTMQPIHNQHGDFAVGMSLVIHEGSLPLIPTELKVIVLLVIQNIIFRTTTTAELIITFN